MAGADEGISPYFFMGLSVQTDGRILSALWNAEGGVPYKFMFHFDKVRTPNGRPRLVLSS